MYVCMYVVYTYTHGAICVYVLYTDYKYIYIYMYAYTYIHVYIYISDYHIPDIVA